MDTKVCMPTLAVISSFLCLMMSGQTFGQVNVQYSPAVQKIINDPKSQAEVQKLINDGLKAMGEKNPAALDLYNSKQTIKILCVTEPAAKKLGFKPTPPMVEIFVGGFAETKGDFLKNGKPKPGGTTYIAIDCGRLKLFGWWKTFDHLAGSQKMWNVLVHELLHATSSARKHPPDKLTLYEAWVKEFNRTIRKARRKAASRYYKLLRDRKKAKAATRPKKAKEVSMLPQWPGGGGLVCTFVPSGKNYGDIGDLSITNTTDAAIAVTVPEGLLLDSADPSVQDLYVASVPTIASVAGAKELNTPITVRPRATYVIKHIPGFCPDFELAPPAEGSAELYTTRPPDEKSRALIATVNAAKEFDVGSIKLEIFGPDKARKMICQSAVWVVDSQVDEVEKNEVTSTVLVDRYWTTFEVSAKEKLARMSEPDRKSAENTVKADLRKIVAATAFLAKNRPDGDPKYDKNGYDKNGYNRRGYNIYGYNKRGYNSRGYNKDGYNRDGFNQYGYDKAGYNRWGRDRFGRTRGRGMGQVQYDKDGYDRFGYDRNGFNRKGMHKNGTKYGAFGVRNEFGWSYGKGYDKDGYDKDGYDRNGFGKDGRDKYGYDKNGYDSAGFDKTGKHRDTGTKYDKNGFDSRYRHKNGTDYDDNGYNRNGFDRSGKHRNGTRYDDEGYDAHAFDKDGYSRDGFDRNRFDRKGVHTGTGTKWDYGGFDKNGKNRHTGTKFDKNGYDQRGLDKNGRNRWGYDEDGYDKNGYDNRGYNKKGLHKDTGTKYNDRGFDRDGKHENGTRYDDDGFDRWGYDKTGKHMDPNRPSNPHKPPTPKPSAPKPPGGHVEG